MQITRIPITQITTNPYQPRKVFSPEQLSELAASIKEYGVIQPVTVRRNFLGGYELISGERRLRASHLAGKEDVPCIIIDADENDSAIIALLENLQRADLTFMEEAEAIYHLVQEHKYTQEQLALKLGKSQSAIANKIRLLRLSDSVKAQIAQNNLTERHARALLRVQDEQLQQKILKIVCEKQLNVTQTDLLIDKTLQKLASPTNEKEGRIRGVVELRMFLNTVNKAIDVVKKAGVPISAQKKDKGDCIEYVIKIPRDKTHVQIT
ncbi:MAG: ParB/RepB/Spo0J family partition protein [Clostridia bacterium]|nr:ParB/RepB/Spo0J family partition protein [Clostridia bacterium]